ncbi:hypothetical protein MRB53_015585 [Persea americana]|uniref:Uncharacterized protein n=1 Tax=Persea americana TaxID=3435 RepID=A0ACC2LZH4_PERAE|nr:hypothetical protein MRB53_015585 [Persea americana]
MDGGLTSLQEPEVVDLAEFLIASGASIEGAGTSAVIISGRKQLHGTEFTIIPDCIEAGTFIMVTAAITRSCISLSHVIPRHLTCVINKLSPSGCKITQRGSHLLEVSASAAGSNLRAFDLKTCPYPGFPPDLQPQFMALLAAWEVNVEKSPLIIEEEETSSFELPPETPPSPMGSPRSETLPRKVRSLHDIYQNCDFALFASEPTCFEDAWEVNVEKSPLIIEEEETSSFELPPETPPSPMGSPRSETLPRKWEVNVEKSPLIIEEEETSSFELPPETPPSPMGSPRSETLPRKVRSLHDIYQNCDFALFASEPTCFEDALQKLGARIGTCWSSAVVWGNGDQSALSGSHVVATDLRALAGMATQGMTETAGVLLILIGVMRG